MFWSPVDPLQWMGAINMSSRTSYQYPAINNQHFCEVKSCMFVRNKFIVKCFNFKATLLAKIQVHNVASSSEKVHPCPSYIKIHQHIYLEVFWTVFTCKKCFICIYFYFDLDPIGDHFSLEKTILWMRTQIRTERDGLKIHTNTQLFI